MANRKPVRYFIFYAGGFKDRPFYLYHESDNGEYSKVRVQNHYYLIDDIVFNILEKTPHIICKVTRWDITRLIAKEKEREYSFFHREKLKKYLKKLSDFINENLDNLRLS
ncbi:hypothetical protein ES702_05896 [subsurface metagenome]